MALKPRMTRSACRICIEALELYAPTLPPDRKEIADETIRNLNYELNRTNTNRAKIRHGVVLDDEKAGGEPIGQPHQD